MSKLNIGRIPIMKGEFVTGNSYDRLWQVTYLGSTYQSKIDNNTTVPAEKVDGKIVHKNTDNWLCIADVTDALNSCSDATTAANTATSNSKTQTSACKTQTDLASTLNANPTYIGTDNYVYKYNTTKKAYEKTTIYVKGDNAYSPKVENGTWWTYDDTNKKYVDTGIEAKYELTKAKVEGVLTGDITSHTHSQYATNTNLEAAKERITTLEGGSATTIETAGTGNAITAISKSGTKITATKGTTFLTSHQDISGKANVSDLTTHTSNKSNPHGVTKAQVGLGNVDNTSDANKPISTATQKALDLKLNTADLASSMYPTFTLQESTNPQFTVKGSVAIDTYLAEMGGYMLKIVDGVVYAAKLKSTNWNYFADGTAVDDASKYETMIHMPTFRYTAEANKLIFRGTGGHTTSDTNCPLDYPAYGQWIGAYKMYVDSDGKGHSRPDVAPSHSKTMSAFWGCAQALNTKFGLANYEFFRGINILFQAKYGNLNSQQVIGTGGQISSWEAWRDVKMGYGRSLGDGSGTAATSMSGQNCVKLFGFEDLWGKLWEFRPGIRFYMQNGKRCVTVYYGNKVSNTDSSRTFEIPLLNSSGNYVTKMMLGEYWDMIPTEVGGSSTTGYCDGYWDSSSGELLYVGGDASNGSQGGLSSASSSSGFSISWSSIGARLAFYASPNIVTGAELVAM